MKEVRDPLRDYNDVRRCITCSKGYVSYRKCDKDLVDIIMNNIGYIKPCDNRPDAYMINDGTLYLFEHFKFDHSKPSKKGSTVQRIDGENTQNAMRLLEGKTGTVSITNHYESSGKYYFDNFIANFNNHVLKVEDYKKDAFAMLGTFNNIKMCFVIEDASPLGSIVKGFPVSLTSTVEFIEEFRKHPELDFVIFAMTQNSGNEIVSFMSYNTACEAFDDLYSIYDIDEFSFNEYHTITGSFFIPFKQ